MYYEDEDQGEEGGIKLSASLEISEDRGITWVEADANIIPPEGTWCRFGPGDGTLDAIYSCICSGILDPVVIADRVGLPVWCVEDLLIEPDESDGDYQKIAEEYKSARRVGAFLRTIPMVLDLSGGEEETL